MSKTEAEVTVSLTFRSFCAATVGPIGVIHLTTKTGNTSEQKKKVFFSAVATNQH